MKYLNTTSKLFCALAVVSLSLAVAGCERPEDPMLKILQTSTTKTRVDNLSRTMDLIFNLKQFDKAELENNVAMGLNLWSGYSGEKFEAVNWQADPQATETLKAFPSLPQAVNFDGTTFLPTDAVFLQQELWCKYIANRVTKDTYLGKFELYRLFAGEFEPEKDDSSPIVSMIGKLHPDLSDDDAAKLASALKLFDWTTRNIQLEPTPRFDEDEIEEQRLVDGDSLVASGLPEPGTRRQPWHVLTFARADFIERAKLFMNFCHRSELPAVMLATQKDDSLSPWAVGVAVGSKLYLFDTRLGLPILQSDGKIATLSDVRENPELLSSLDLSVEESLADDTKYWVGADELKSLVGLVYWTPESASNRIAALEANLLGRQQLPLVNNPAETIKQLPDVDGVQYKAWDIELRTLAFRKVLAESLPKAVSDDTLAQKLGWYFTEEDYVIRFPNYRTARARFYKGKFARSVGVRSNRDAIESFAILTYNDNVIASLETDRSLQLQLQLQRGDTQSPVEFEREIRSRQQLMRLVRRDAGLFMCQGHFDNGSFSTTANWLPTLLDASDNERWTPGLAYLHGRALESQHYYDKAIKALKADGGPQQHGNLIRARLLQKQLDTHFADVTRKSDDTQ